jgi:DNA polymerase-3 subunit delta'
MNSIFDNIHGHDKPLILLTNFLKSEKIPHALLFTGQEGIGKYFTALQFIKLANQSEILNNASLDKKISNLSEPYVKFILPLPRGKGETNKNSPTEKLSDELLEQVNSELRKKIKNPYHKISIEKANNIKINSIREIKKTLTLNYSNIKYRFVVISDAHLMNDEAQNALLKSLEEPPAGVIFILLTPFKNRLLPTINSRCWEIKFNPLSHKDVEYILIDFLSIDKNEAAKVSLFSNGSVNTALELLENDYKTLIDKIIMVLRYSLGKRYHSAFKELNDISLMYSKNHIKFVLEFLNRWFKDAQRYRLNLDNYEFNNYLDVLERFNNKFIDINPNDIVGKLNKLAEAVDKNVNLNILSMNIIFELASIVKRSE